VALASALERLCVQCVERLPVDQAVIHLMIDGDVGVAAASDASAAACGELPFLTGVGPCFDAIRLRRPVIVPDLAVAGDRWPGYVAAMQELGVRAVHSCPLQLGAVGLGVLDLYAGTPGSLPQDDLAAALSLARRATEILLHGEGGGADGAVAERVDALGDLLDHRSEIFQAQGAVMVALEVPLGEAMLRLRAHAFATGLPLVELARMVLADLTSPESW
jgi:hypothetical protein